MTRSQRIALARYRRRCDLSFTRILAAAYTQQIVRDIAVFEEFKRRLQALPEPERPARQTTIIFATT